MHELAICQSLLREVEKIAAHHDAAKVVSIRLSVGPLSGIDSQQLARAFQIARVESIAQDAILKIENIPVRVQCKICGCESQVQPNMLGCDKCQSCKVEILSGDELTITELEVEQNLERVE